MRYGRLLVNLAITGACLGLIALEIAGPGDSVTARRPVDTFTHVDVKVDDQGVHSPDQKIAAGQVEITLTDARTHTTGALTVTSDPNAFSLHPGTQLTTIRDLTTYRLIASVGAHAMPGTATLAIVMPTLAAPTESAHQVTVNVETSGVDLPHRDARFDAPVAPGANDATSAAVPWTTVASGPARVVIHNHQPGALTCKVNNGTSVTIASGASRSIRATFAPGENFVDCATTKVDLLAL
jgi:hypothetical protein